MQLFKLGIINLKYALYLKCQLAIFHIRISKKINHKHSFYNNINKSLFILTSLKLKCRFYELAVCFAMAINLPIINYESQQRCALTFNVWSLNLHLAIKGLKEEFSNHPALMIG